MAEPSTKTPILNSEQDEELLTEEGTANLEPAEVPGEAMKEEVGARPQELDLILDIPLRVSVELGRTKILVQDLLKLHRGSVLELNKLAGEPLEILVNEKVVAKGEVVVVNEKFGIRLTDIVNHTQRIQRLGD